MDATITYTLLYDDTSSTCALSPREREEASVQLSQRFSKSLTGIFRFAYRRVSVSNVVIPVLLIPQLVQPVRIGIFTANFVQDRRDNPDESASRDLQHGRRWASREVLRVAAQLRPRA